MRVGAKRADIKLQNQGLQIGELRGIFGRPGRVIFAKLDFEVAFCGENIHGQAAMP